MRTLNRPMFNMGGPIKEGVMHGIREPDRGGQLVQPGPGRPGYAGKPPTTKLGIAGWLAKKIPFLKQPVKTISKSTKDIIPKTWGKIKNIYKGGPKDKGYVPPGALTNRWYWEKGIKPTLGLTGAAAKKALPYAGTAGVVGGLTYGLWPDGTPKTTEELIEDNVIRKGDKDYGPHTKGGPTITQEMRDAKAKADKEKRINALLDTMGYDKARKNAAYDALIDAGRMISERGTLDPKNIGRELIDPIVATTSARFDKPEQIREAVGLMQVKADIAKQMEDPQVAEQRRLNIEVSKKGLGGPDFKEVITNKIIKGEAASGGTLAQILRATEGIDAIVLPIEIPTNKDPLQVATEIIKETWTNPEKPRVDPGYYVVSDRVIIVDEQGNVTPYH